MPTPEQFAGCLIGKCVGDAIGYPIEGQTPKQCREYIDRCIRPGVIESWSGQYSDDSQFARELVQSIVSCGTFDPVHYARHVCALFAENRIVGPGMGATAAAMRLAQGVPWDQAGTPAPSAGNGTAMRVAPLGLFYCHDHESLVGAARNQARVTHQDPRCHAGAIAIAGATALAVLQTRADPVVFLPRVAAWCRQEDPVLAEAIGQISEWRNEESDTVREIVKAIGVVPDHWSHGEGIPPFVTQSVLWALYAFICEPDDFTEAICLAISGGGDVDTTAAMTGAMCGARLGLSAVPKHWARRVNDGGTWGHRELIHLAEACYGIHQGLYK